jgi:hypothetical protein
VNSRRASGHLVIVCVDLSESEPTNSRKLGLIGLIVVLRNLEFTKNRSLSKLSDTSGITGESEDRNSRTVSSFVSTHDKS